MGWGRGKEHATPRMILTMIMDLPKNSRFMVKTALEREDREDEAEENEPSEDQIKRWERRYWSDPQLELLAANVNAIERLYYVLPQWKKDKGPKYPVVIGPREWWTDAQKRDQDKKKVGKSESSELTVADALKALGATF